MRPATHPTSAEARHGVGTARASKQWPRGIRGRWQTVRDCLPFISDASIALVVTFIGWGCLNLIDRVMFGMAVAHAG